MNVQALTNAFTGNRHVMVVVLAIAAAVIASAVQAGAGGAQFTPIWTEISGWFDGTPGKLIVILTFGASVYNVVRSNYMMMAGALIIAFLMANIVDIVNGVLTAGLPVTLG